MVKFEARNGANFGATVTEVRLATMSEEEWVQIEAAFLKYGVLVFPGQHLSDEEQLAFGLCFGESEMGSLFPGGTGNFTLSNDRSALGGYDHGDKGGKSRLFEPGSKAWLSQVGNEGWHTGAAPSAVWSRMKPLGCWII